MTESLSQPAERGEGFNALEFINVGDTIAASCFTGDADCDCGCGCPGKGLFNGGVGGALFRANGLSKAKDVVVGVPLYGGDEA